jgi:hypothetical protein
MARLFRIHRLGGIDAFLRTVTHARLHPRLGSASNSARPTLTRYLRPRKFKPRGALSLTPPCHPTGVLDLVNPLGSDRRL